MLTLNQAIERLRRDLGDIDVATAAWSTDQLQRHLEHAMADISLEIPVEQSTTLTTTADSRDVSLATLSRLIKVVSLEWPTGNYPPTYVRFSVWGTTATMLVPAAPSAAENVTVRWQQLHTIDPSGATLPEWAEELTIMGAAGYAAEELAAGTANTVNTGGQGAPQRYHQMAMEKLAAFHQALRAHGDKGGIRTHSMYTPAEPRPSQSTEPGP